jgi:drug/metabolite transporter (DMT)-like permease
MATRLGRIPGVVLISIAAVMWGTDAIFRRPLAQSTSATTIVFGEHVILVAITLPLLVPALVALWRAGPSYVLAGIGLGAGASALATILFTQAFAHGDPITPIVLQKIQPLVAVAGAALLLGERPRPRFAWFLVPALLGIWLIGVPHPLDPHAYGMTPILESLGAAVLWGLGTVLGRFLSRELRFEHVMTVRFAFGLVASAIALPLVGAKAYAGLHDTVWIAYLAIVTGLAALTLYYIGLQRTPAMIASLAELAYPVTAVLVGIYIFDSSLRWTQWIGVAIVVGVVSLLPVQRRRDVVALAPADARLASAPA